MPEQSEAFGLVRPGEWRGNGTHGYKGYWWYVRLDGTLGETHWCEHSHLTSEAALRCGQKNAALRNRSLRRVGGGRFSSALSPSHTASAEAVEASTLGPDR